MNEFLQRENRKAQFAYLEGQKIHLEKRIAGMVQPLAHGTTSEHLIDILESRGLGARLARNSYGLNKRHMSSATDLTKPVGLELAYLFSRLNLTHELVVTRKSIDGKDAIARVVELNPVKRDEKILREMFDDYIHKRKPIGFPILLIFDGGGVPVLYSNKSYPSEVTFQDIIPLSKLKILLVPQTRISAVKSTLLHYKLPTQVMPIESMEIVHDKGGIVVKFADFLRNDPPYKGFDTSDMRGVLAWDESINHLIGNPRWEEKSMFTPGFFQGKDGFLIDLEVQLLKNGLNGMFNTFWVELSKVLGEKFDETDLSKYRAAFESAKEQFVSDQSKKA